MLPWFRISSGAAGVVGLLSGILGVGVNRRQGRPYWLSLVCAAALALLATVSLRGPADLERRTKAALPMAKVLTTIYYVLSGTKFAKLFQLLGIKRVQGTPCAHFQGQF